MNKKYLNFLKTIFCHLIHLKSHSVLVPTSRHGSVPWSVLPSLAKMQFIFVRPQANWAEAADLVGTARLSMQGYMYPYEQKKRWCNTKHVRHIYSSNILSILLQGSVLC